MTEKLGEIKESDHDIDTFYDSNGRVINPPKDRPKVVYLRQAHSIMVIVKGKRYFYNIHDIPSR